MDNRLPSAAVHSVYTAVHPTYTRGTPDGVRRQTDTPWYTRRRTPTVHRQLCPLRADLPYTVPTRRTLRTYTEQTPITHRRHAPLRTDLPYTPWYTLPGPNSTDSVHRCVQTLDQRRRTLFGTFLLNRPCDNAPGRLISRSRHRRTTVANVGQPWTTVVHWSLRGTNGVQPDRTVWDRDG